MKHIIKLIALVLLVFSVSSTGYSEQPQWIVTEGQAQGAYQYALGYVKHDVAYLLGGRYSLEGYLDSLAQGREPGQDIGVDSSAVVLNAYRSLIPNIRFYTRNATARDISSSTLFYHNSKPLAKDEVRRGDLVFFKSDRGSIIGVGLFSHFDGDVVHFIVASANAGQVVLTNAQQSGRYWQNSFAGFGRLQYTLTR